MEFSGVAVDVSADGRSSGTGFPESWSVSFSREPAAATEAAALESAVKSAFEAAAPICLESESAPGSRVALSVEDTAGATVCSGAIRQRQVNSPVLRRILRNALRKSARSIKFSASKCPTPSNTSAFDGSSLSSETKSASRFSRSPPSTWPFNISSAKGSKPRRRATSANVCFFGLKGK